LGFPDAIEKNLTQAQYSSYWPVRQVTQMFLAETPPPYSGGTSASRGRIMPVPSSLPEFVPLSQFPDPMTLQYAPDTGEIAILNSLISVGEQFLIRFDFKGPWFVVQRNINSSSGASQFQWRGATSVQTGATFAQSFAQ